MTILRKSTYIENLNQENGLTVLANVNTVSETKRIVNCSNLSRGPRATKECQCDCGHSVLSSSSSTYYVFSEDSSTLFVKVPLLQ